MNEDLLWPETATGDRILNQLMYVPSEKLTKPMKILINDKSGFGINRDSNLFGECPVKNCILTNDQSEADAVLFRNYMKEYEKRPPNQVKFKNFIKSIFNFEQFLLGRVFFHRFGFFSH